MKRLLVLVLLSVSVGLGLVAVEATPLSPTVDSAEAGWYRWDQGCKGQWWWQQEDGYWFWSPQVNQQIFMPNSWARRYGYWHWECGNLGVVRSAPHRYTNTEWRVNFDGGFLSWYTAGYNRTCFYYPNFHCHWV